MNTFILLYKMRFKEEKMKSERNKREAYFKVF